MTSTGNSVHSGGRSSYRSTTALMGISSVGGRSASSVWSVASSSSMILSRLRLRRRHRARRTTFVMTGLGVDKGPVRGSPGGGWWETGDRRPWTPPWAGLSRIGASQDGWITTSLQCLNRPSSYPGSNGAGSTPAKRSRDGPPEIPAVGRGWWLRPGTLHDTVRGTADEPARPLTAVHACAGGSRLFAADRFTHGPYERAILPPPWGPPDPRPRSTERAPRRIWPYTDRAAPYLPPSDRIVPQMAEAGARGCPR